MNKKKTKIALAFAMLLCIGHIGNAFAENIYNIEYAGGEPLGTDNVTVDESLASLTPIYNNSNKTVSVSDSNEWTHAYLQLAGQCTPYHVLQLPPSDGTNNYSGVYYTLSNSLYDVRVQINKIITDNIDKPLVVGVAELNGYIYAGHGGASFYSDSDCATKYDESGQRLTYNDHGHIFVETNIKVYNHGTNDIFTSDKMYFGLTDIDAAQSFKLLNVPLEDNMFVASEDALVTVDDYNNMYVASGNYIYSENSFDTPERNNIFLEVDTTSQQQGLNVIFGYGTVAGSGVRYYAEQYNVKYESEEEGTITGVTEENIISGNNPSGSTATPEAGFVLDHWVADKNITLEDNTEIEAGEPITSAQIGNIVVTEDLIFTASYRDVRPVVEYISDDNGEITGITDEPVLPGENPTGSESTAKENYEFEYWIADEDVTLEDGTEIKAGDPITPEQVKDIVVDRDIILTAIHKALPAPEVPNTGLFSKGSFGTGEISLSVVAIIAVAAIIKFAPVIFRKRIDFDK